MALPLSGNNDCLEEKTLVMLADGRGSKCAGDVVLGDKLQGTGGRIALVTRAPESHQEKSMFRITAHGGANFSVSAGHLVTLGWRRRTWVHHIQPQRATNYRSVLLQMWRSDTLECIFQSFRFRLKHEPDPAQKKSDVYLRYEDAVAAYDRWRLANNPHNGYVYTRRDAAKGVIHATIFQGKTSRTGRHMPATSFAWAVGNKAYTPEPRVYDTRDEKEGFSMATAEAWQWYNSVWDTDTLLSDISAPSIPCDTTDEPQTQPDESDNSVMTMKQRMTVHGQGRGGDFGYRSEHRGQRIPQCLRAGEHKKYTHTTDLTAPLPAGTTKHWSLVPAKERGWRPLDHGDLIEVRAGELAKPGVLSKLMEQGTASARVCLVLNPRWRPPQHWTTLFSNAAQPETPSDQTATTPFELHKQAALVEARARAGPEGRVCTDFVQLMTGLDNFRPMVAADRVKLALFLHHPLSEVSLMNSAGVRAQTIDQLRMAVSTFYTGLTERDGVIITELNPIVAATGTMMSLDSSYESLCIETMKLALVTGAKAIVAFGRAARVRWQTLAARLPGVLEAVTTYSDEDRVHSTWLWMSDGQPVRVVHSPHPCLRHKLLEVTLAVRAARIHLGYSHPPLTADEFVGLVGVGRSLSTFMVGLQSVEPVPAATVVAWEVDGDGRFVLANGVLTHNCPMIESADIGVGIAGVEGTSAVSSSDFALSQFRFLPRLLLVHGRLNHRRISVMINYIFYKTAFVVWALFFFGIYSQFSGQVFILDWAFQLHNVAYTALPIIVFAIFDFDLRQDTLQRHPHIYPLTRYSGDHLSFWRAFVVRHPSSLFFSYWDFFEWILVSIIHALICFFIAITAFNTGVSPDSNGQQYGLFEQGLLIYTAIIVVTNCMLVYWFCSWTYLHHLSLWGSLALYVAAMCLFSSSPIFDIAGASFYYSWYRLCSIPAFYLTILVCVAGCMLVTAFWVQGKRWLALKEEKVWMEAEKLGALEQDGEREEEEGEGKGKQRDGEEESSEDEDEDDEGESDEEDVRYRRMEERREKGRKQQRKAEDEKKEAVLDVGSGDEQERKTPRRGDANALVSPRRVPQRSPHRPSGEGYTGSLFSYTPGIRSLRNIVDI